MKLLSVDVVRSVVRFFFLYFPLKKNEILANFIFFLPGLGGCYDDVFIFNL